MADSIIYTTHDNDLLNGDEDFYFFSIYPLFYILLYPQYFSNENKNKNSRRYEGGDDVK